MQQPEANLVPGPTVVPLHLRERYANTFYGSGDLEPECMKAYNDCCASLEQLLSFESERAKGGSTVIMTGEGMVGLWAGLKCVIPWPFYHSEEDGSLKMDTGRKYKVLCIGNGVYGCWMKDMVKSLRYPNVEIQAIDSPWDQAVDVAKSVRTIQDWKPDLVTMVHCDTPTGALNSEAVCAVGKACSNTDALFYVDIVSSAGAVPIDVSGWGIDIGLLGTQKAFSCEPSLTIITVSAKAWKQIEKVAYTGYDALLPFKDFQKSGLFPYTPLWSALDALNVHLKEVFGSKGDKRQHVYDKHEKVAEYCRERVRQMGLKLWWTDDRYSSPSVTAIRVPDNTTWEELDKKLRKEGVILGGSYGQTANALFRVGHMGTQADMATVQRAMDALEKIVNKLGEFST